MAKSKYDDYTEIIMEMHWEDKKATEIARFLNENDKNINAEESGLRSFIKRTLAENEQEEETEDIEEEDDSQEKIRHLSELLEKMEEKNSLLQKESVVQGKLLNNLENIKSEYEEIIKRYSILNDTMHETIIITKEDNSRKKLYCWIAAGWIISILMGMFAGYYIGRCYARTAFHYLLTLTALPAGIFIGLAINYGKNKLSEPDTSDVYRRACELAKKRVKNKN